MTIRLRPLSPGRIRAMQQDELSQECHSEVVPTRKENKTRGEFYWPTFHASQTSNVQVWNVWTSASSVWTQVCEITPWGIFSSEILQTHAQNDLFAKMFRVWLLFSTIHTQTYSSIEPCCKAFFSSAKKPDKEGDMISFRNQTASTHFQHVQPPLPGRTP